MPETSPAVELVAAAALPTAIQHLIVEELPELHEALSTNRYLDPEVTIRMLGNAPAKMAKNLVKQSRSPAVAEFVINSDERRDSVIEALCRVWHLGPELQVALATRKLSPSLASLLAGSTWVLPETKLLLQRGALATDRLSWLEAEGDQLEPELVWDELCSLLAAPARELDQVRPDRVAQVLVLHPALVARAAASTSTMMLDAASRLVLDPEHQLSLLARLEQRMAPGSYDASSLLTLLANLLDSPSASAEVVRRGWELAERLNKALDLHRQFVPGPCGPLPRGVRLEDLQGEVVDLVLCRSSSRGWNGGRHWQWCALARNPNLSRPQAAQLLEHLHEFSSRSHLGRHWDIASAHLVEAHQLRSEFPQVCDELARNRREREETTTTAASIRARGTSPTSKTNQCHIPNPRPGAHARIEVSPSWGRPWNAEPFAAGQYLVAQLGEDRAAWQVALSLSGDFTGTVAELAELSQLTCTA